MRLRAANAAINLEPLSWEERIKYVR